MRVLLLHPEDDPENGPWVDHFWDIVVDLGITGAETRARWQELFQCPVEPLPKLEMEDYAVFRRALAAGLDRLVDGYGIDWWELISVRFYEQIDLALRLRRLLLLISASDQLFLTRDGIHASIISQLTGKVVCCVGRNTSLRRTFHQVRNLSNFSVRQLLQFAADKHDPGYRFRRFLVHRPERPTRDVVLLPAAHVNAARTALAYAAMLPDHEFLLVATRHNGWISKLPQNTAATKLAWYAPGKCDCEEYRRLLARWQQLESDLLQNSELSIFGKLGLFAGVPKLLRVGMAIRDAWTRVFEREPVRAVLCTDDTNPYTNIPLLLARDRGLPTVACHHGALDGYYLVKRSHARVVFAKGQMEKDYLVNICRLPEGKIEVGAPAVSRGFRKDGTSKQDAILFFSEPYALGGGRCRDIYREVLPPLADLARRMGRKLIVKLHPMESMRERSRFIEAILSSPQRQNVEIVSGALSEDLLDRTHVAVTLQSTAAVDCAIRGIPVFLCTWLGYSHFGYVDQFIKFGVGVPLDLAADIANIPEILKTTSLACAGDLWKVISQEKLRELLTSDVGMAVAV